jgi:hypothetical protein
MKHEAEYEKLARQGSYYDELLRMGHVVARVADTKAWRDEIKAKARGDKIKVRTGLSHHDDHVVWAYLKHLDVKVRRGEYNPRLLDHLGAVQEAFERARLRGHTVTRVIRAEGARAAAACPECGARPYVDWTTMPPFMEGEVFDADCTAVDFD